jgi:hypothetical protein
MDILFPNNNDTIRYIKGVRLNTNNTKEEVLLEFTGLFCTNLRELMGTDLSFLGQYEEIDVVIICARQPTEHILERNHHHLPPPFNNDVVIGPLILNRMDKNSNPQPFTLQNYERFLRRMRRHRRNSF